MDELTELHYKQICEYTIWLDMVVHQVRSTFYLNHSAAGQSAAQKTTHVCVLE